MASLAVVGALRLGAAPAESDYLRAARTFADVMLAHGRDRLGEVPTALWCGVIDAETLRVPQRAEEVPALPGIRNQDRAVGGSNYYHDLGALVAFRALTEVTGEQVYARAADDYTRDFLRLGQSPETGLLAWGEHLYYDVFRDRVAAERIHHEFLAGTPPWAQFHRIDPVATAKAIAGIRHHFRSFEPDDFLFNRHTPWLAPAFQEAGQPWIKHTGLQAYSFAFLYSVTGDDRWLKWLRGTGSLYWDRRHPVTGLVPGCIGDPRDQARQSGLGGTALLAYFLLQAWELAPGEGWLRERAEALLVAAEKYSRAEAGYFERTTVEGEPATGLMTPWSVRYGQSSLLEPARIAARFARTFPDGPYREMALHMGAMAFAEQPPADAVVGSVAQAIHLALDLHALDGDGFRLELARRYADDALARYARNGLFVRVPGDRYYEAKVGPGDLAAALVRLHLRLNPRTASSFDDLEFSL